MENIQIIRTFSQAVFFVLSFLAILHMHEFGGYMLAAILFFGVFFCGWVCPFGSVQEWVGRLGDFFGIKKYCLPRAVQNYAQMVRYLVYALTLYKIVYMPMNARITFGRGVAKAFSETAPVAFGFMSFFILLSLFTHRPFCNYFCEKGAQFGLFSVLRVFSIKRDVKKCIGCAKCDRTCPMHIEISKTDFVRHPNCINCFRCISGCSKKTLSYTATDFIHFKKGKK